MRDRSKSLVTLLVLGFILVLAAAWGWSAATEPLPERADPPLCEDTTIPAGELRLPKGSSVAMVIRDGETLVPETRTVLRHADDLLVVTPRKCREATEERLRQVSAGGRLAQWLGDDDRT